MSREALRYRLLFGGEVSEHAADQRRALRARFLMYAALAGGVGGVVGVLFASGPSGEPRLLLVGGACLLIAAITFVGFDRLPGWSFSVFVVIGTCLVSIANVWEGDGEIASQVFYAVIGVYAGYFLSRRQALLQLAFIAVAYGAVLIDRSGVDGAISQWAVTLAAVVAVTVMVIALREEVDRRIAGLEIFATTDSLTGLPNRRSFVERLDGEIHRATRYGRSLALLTGDLDRFKSVNDALGHPGGDQVLRRVASVFKRTVRGVDMPARVGGEEFSIIATDAPPAEAVRLAERLRCAIEAEFAGGPVALTISFGCASLSSELATSDALIAAADKALYVAKRTGRNRTVAYDAVAMA